MVILINSFVVFIVATFLSFYAAKEREKLPIISWSFLAVALIYGVGSSVVFSATLDGVIYLRSDIVLSSINYWSFYGPLVLILTIGIFLGWRLPILGKAQVKKLSKYSFDIELDRMMLVAYILLIIGFLLRWLYVQPYGGFVGYLAYNQAIRAGIFEIDNPYSFFKPFGALVFFSSYFFWALLLSKYRMILASLGFILSVLFSLYVLYSNAGRVSFILYLASFVIAYVSIKKISSRVILTFCFIGFPLTLVTLFYISNYFGLKASESVSGFVIKETSFIYVSFFAQLAEGHLFRLFTDFIFAPTHLMPSSITSKLFEFQEASQTNTALISGAIKGQKGVTGTIPVDLLTLGLMQINVVGIFPVGVMFGYFIKYVDYFLYLIKNTSLRSILFAYASLRLGFVGLLYAYPAHFVGGLFPFIVLMFILLVISFVSRIKFSN